MMTTKKINFASSSIGVIWWFSLFGLYSHLSSVGRYCYMNYVGVCGLITNLLDVTTPWMLPIFSWFFVSLILLFFDKRVFDTWFFKFAVWAAPLSVLSVLVTANSRGGGMGLVSFETKPLVALVTSFFFVLTSLIIIAYKFFTLKKGGAGK